jgi:hypothetical protein
MTAGLGTLSRLDIGTAGRSLDNAVVDVIGGPTGLTVGQTVILPSGQTQVTLRVRRLDASRPVTVPISVVDGCGAWSTFVGGGAGSF